LTIESVNEDLAKLEQDVRRLTADSEHLAEDVADQARVLGQEALAAEYIATEEVVENMGSILEMMSVLGDIQRDQFKQFFSDGKTTLEGLSDVRGPGDLMSLSLDHWKRRAEHISDGLSKVVEVLADESRFLSNTMTEMWKPFGQMVRGDWGRNQS
jgi:hypothetical protein